MQDDFFAGLERLRASAPRLNDAADLARKTIQSAEFALGEVGVGLTARSSYFSRRFLPTEDGSETISSCLAYGRLGGKYRVHIIETTIRNDSNGGRTAISEDHLHWACCPREIKLKSFAKLPELLVALADAADRMIADAEGIEEEAGKILDAIRMEPVVKSRH